MLVFFVCLFGLFCLSKNIKRMDNNLGKLNCDNRNYKLSFIGKMPSEHQIDEQMGLPDLCISCNSAGSCLKRWTPLFSLKCRI